MTPLSSRDLAALARAQQVVLSPLDHPSPEAWLRAVIGVLQDLFGADRAVATVGGPDGAAVFVASDVDDRALAEYEADFVEADGAGEIVLGHAVPYYVEEDFARDSRFGAHAASAVYNEWYRPQGLTDAVGLLVLGAPAHVPGLYARHEAAVVANVLLAGTALSGGAGAGRARTMLALLQPALAASVGVWLRTARAAAEAVAQVGATADGLGAAAWVYDGDGRLVHQSAGVGRWEGADALRTSADVLAQDLLQARREGRPVPPARTAVVGGEPFRLMATYHALGSAGVPAVLVAVEKAGPEAPDVDALRERFGLTRQQARVALLLAARRSTAEIAEALFISPHTVRRHTEQVFERLGVSRRTDVEAALRQPADAE